MESAMEREIEILNLRQCTPQELYDLEASAERTRLDAIQMLREIPPGLRTKYGPTWKNVVFHAEVLQRACQLVLQENGSVRK